MSDPRRKVEETARLSYGRLVASLTFRLGSISRAEDALCEALVRALETWPQHGLPDNPEAWLISTARNKGIDQMRSDNRPSNFKFEIEALYESINATENEDEVDPRLRLMFTCAHTAIDADIRAPLMLQTVLGVDVLRMASAFLLPPGTLGQRLTRAKAKIETSSIPFTLPSNSDEYGERIEDILAAIYAAYAVGQTGSATGDVKSTNLANEALWLVSTLCNALPEASEAHGLFALILFTESRQAARVNPKTGVLIPLQQQNTKLWHTDLLVDAEQALRNAQRNMSLGRFQLEASIQSIHAARRTTGETDWKAIQILYKGLVLISPTVGALTAQAAIEAELNGPQAGLELLEKITHSKRDNYQPWHAVRAYMLSQLGDTERAAIEFDKAIGLSNDPAARMFLLSQKSYIELI